MLVEDVPSSIDYDDIETYFQTESFSGGGETESVSKKQDTFKVLFEDAEGIITADLYHSNIYIYFFLLCSFTPKN